jgi:hypothetical protein
MVLARRNLSTPGKASFKQLIVLHVDYVDQSPPGNALSAVATDLPTEKANLSILNTVVVRLSDSILALVFELDQPLLFDGAVKQKVQFLIDSHASHIRQISQYFLARGGISEISTGSNSNFGSSASGAK